MGEYAIRKSDNQEIKIGTCKDMYYIRYEDRKMVKYLKGNVDAQKETGLRWRLPFPDEEVRYSVSSRDSLRFCYNAR